MAKEVEYTEVNNNLRHYGNMRFAQLTIYFALMGALISFFYSNRASLEKNIIICIEIGGIILSGMFWIMEESSTSKWIAYKERANELEKELNYKQLRKSPVSGLFSATNATRIIFICGIIFWFVVIFT